MDFNPTQSRSVVLTGCCDLTFHSNLAWSENKTVELWERIYLRSTGKRSLCREGGFTMATLENATLWTFQGLPSLPLRGLRLRN